MSIPADGGGGSATIAYPTQRMAESAQQIRTTANNALTSHDLSWIAVQSYVELYPPFMQAPLLKLLDTYQKRLRSSYTTYLQFADWLDYARGQMQHMDNNISESFFEFIGAQK